MHFAGHRDNRRQSQIGEDNSSGADRRFHPGHTERRNALRVQVLRFKEGEQRHHHQQRHQKLEHADEVVRTGEGLDAVVIQRKEETEQQELHYPPQQRRRAGARLGQHRKPGRGVLPGGDDFYRDQAGEGNQGDEPQQIAHQLAVGKDRVADNAAGARQRRPQLTVDNPQQQYRKAADHPRRDPGRTGNGCDVAGGE